LSYTLQEISNQSVSWRQTLNFMNNNWEALQPALEPSADTCYLFIGSGTSFYLAQSASRLFQQLTGKTATAVPSSEIFLAAESSIPKGVPITAFAISRSGTTSEVLLAVEFLQKNYPHVQIIGVTCHSDHKLAQMTPYSISLDHASEKSVVMTQSFTNMLLALQYTSAKLAEREDLIQELQLLPDLLNGIQDEAEAFGKTWGELTEYSQFIFLGLGSYYGLAAEATLKLKEMTQTACEYYNPLEFRHGPISIVGKGTAVIILSGDGEAEYIHSLVNDIENFNGTTSVLASTRFNQPSLTLPGIISDWSRTILYMPALQFIAYYRAQKLGLNPDQPRNLNQVVII
jgi:glucosamine--fructose-6-phosphate aminotransferase (isomerizing)